VCLFFICFQKAYEEDRRILIQCDYGNSSSPAILALYLLLKHNIRVEESLPLIAEARPRVAISQSLLRGIETCQRSLDGKKLDRLNQRLKKSDVLSLGF